MNETRSNNEHDLDARDGRVDVQSCFLFGHGGLASLGLDALALWLLQQRKSSRAPSSTLSHRSQLQPLTQNPSLDCHRRICAILSAKMNGDSYSSRGNALAVSFLTTF